MTWRRLLLPALGAFALVAAVGLALAAAAVKRSADGLRHADTRFEVTKPHADVWESTGPSTRVGRRLLGLGDDLTFRKSARLFRLSQEQPLDYLHSTELKEGTPDQLRAEATIILERFTKRDSDRVRKSRTANLLAIMAYQDSIQDQTNGASLLERTGDDFRAAIKLDPRSDAAKFNLELFLQLEAKDGGAFAIRSGGATGGTGAITGAKPQGRGY